MDLKDSQILIFEAVRSGDLQQTRTLLQAHPELVNWTDPSLYGHTALHYAVLARMPQMVRLLMQLGANPYSGIYPFDEATNPLAIAGERGYDEIAAIMREEEKRREEGRPVAAEVPRELRRALRSHHEDDAIRILQDNPQLVTFQMPGNRRTLLHFAADNIWIQVAGWLLDHGADPDAQDEHGAVPLDLLGEGDGASPLSRMLMDRGAKMTLRSAVILGDIDFLKKRHAEEDIVTPRDPDGWLLRLAVDHNRRDILQMLLDLKFDPDARVQVKGEENSFTWGVPLYQCTRYRKHAMAQMLLERGADPNGQVYASGTPLSEAYGQQDDAMIALLEKYGGKSNPSMAGLYRRKDLAIRLLAEYGDTELPDDGFSKGKVADQLLGSAARGGDPEILQMGMERVTTPDGDRRWNELLPAPLGFWNHWIGPWCHQEWDRTTYLRCFKMILARCGPPNGRLRHGTTILHAIVLMGDHVTREERVAFAQASLDAGARTDLRDDLLKSTPLGWACRWGREELVHLLLQHGVPAVEPDAERWAQPLAWAEKKHHDSIAAILRNSR